VALCPLCPVICSLNYACLLACIDSCASAATDVHNGPFCAKLSSCGMCWHLTDNHHHHVLDHFQNLTNPCPIHNLFITQKSSYNFLVILATNRQGENVTCANLGQRWKLVCRWVDSWGLENANWSLGPSDYVVMWGFGFSLNSFGVKLMLNCCFVC